jgi:hypothetical protein
LSGTLTRGSGTDHRGGHRADVLRVLAPEFGGEGSGAERGGLERERERVSLGLPRVFQSGAGVERQDEHPAPEAG